MEYYNFINEETYHFFVWVTKSNNEVKPKELIEQAFKDAETPDPTVIESDDICQTVLEKLIIILDETLEEILAEVLGEDDRIGEVNGWDHSLWRPLLKLAASRIHFDVVALALLIQAGKWNPSGVPPEI